MLTLSLLLILATNLSAHAAGATASSSASGAAGRRGAATAQCSECGIVPPLCFRRPPRSLAGQAPGGPPAIGPVGPSPAVFPSDPAVESAAPIGWAQPAGPDDGQNVTDSSWERVPAEATLSSTSSNLASPDIMPRLVARNSTALRRG